MDQSPVTQAQSNIEGSYSGNRGSNNIIGSNLNTYVLPNVTNLEVGNQGSICGNSNQAPSPYRLIPYCRNTMFTGRKYLIESVKRFAEGEGHSRVALQGLGGSGKTQIALEYIYQRINESDSHVFWVQGSGLLKFREGFRDVAELARIPLASAGDDEDDFLRYVRRWFQGPSSGDWILVIDNADNEHDFAANNSPIAKFIPQGAKGTVIFTTRSQQVAFRQGCKTIAVGQMGEEEAWELFSKRFGYGDSLEEAEKKVVKGILESVHHLPLAVVGSAAFMVETATPPSVYWDIFQENEGRMKELLSQEFCDIQQESDAIESVLGTFFVTFDRIRQQMPPAADLLRLMAFFDRQNIPEELLSQSGLEGIGDTVQFRLAIGKLAGFSLITVVKREERTLYELHRLVQLSLQVYLHTDDFNEGRSAALRVVSRHFPRDENQRRLIGPAYISHAIAVTKYLGDPTTEELCFQMGRYFLDMGFYNNAEIRFRQCIALRQEGKEYDWDDNGHLRLMNLGVVSSCQGKFNEAERITRQVLEECEKMVGADHVDTLTSTDALATVLRKRGKYDESERMSRRALEGREKGLGPHHPDTLQSVSNLGELLWALGNYKESEAMDRRALDGREKVLGQRHPDTLRSIRNLAVTLWSQGKYSESEAMHCRALDGRATVLGPHHPDTLTSISNLAVTLWSQGKYSESEAMDRRVLDGRERVLGPHHPDTLTNANNLAITLSSQGKYSESEAMDRRALGGREKVLGPHHPSTLTSINNLAITLSRQGKYSESEAMHRRVLDGREKVLGPHHPDTLTSISNLAVTLLRQGKCSESEAMDRRVLDGRERVLGPHHPATLTSANNLAITLWSQGKCSESEAMGRRALRGREKVLGPHHPDTLTSMSHLAAKLSNQGKYRESEAMHRRALEGREKILGSDHPDTLHSARSLALVLRNQKRPLFAARRIRGFLRGALGHKGKRPKL